MKKFRLLFIILFLAKQPSYLNGQEDIAACRFELLSHNSNTQKIVASVMLNLPSLLSSVSWWNRMRLATNICTYKQWAEEIAEKTHGIGNIIKRLAKKIETETTINLSDDIVSQLVSLSTTPLLNKEALTAIQMLKRQYRFLIGIGNQDPLEHEIYTLKMSTDHNIDLSKLFDQIVTVANYDDPHEQLGQGGSKFYSIAAQRHISANPYPSESFKAAIMKAANTLDREITIMPPVICTMENLKALTSQER